VRELGTFLVVTDVRRANGAAVTTAALAFAALAGAALALGKGILWVVALVLGPATFFFTRSRARARLPRGRVELEEDARLGQVLTMRRVEVALHRVPLAKARVLGRTLALGDGTFARTQVAVLWDEGAFAAKLAVPFQAAPADVEGQLPAVYELDRDASRALDALSYDIRSLSERRG
jgi:hypothetical protein